MRLLGTGAAVIVLGVISVALALFLLGGDDDSPDAPRLIRAVDLLDLPVAGARVLARLEVDTELAVLGRDPGGNWLSVAPLDSESAASVAGWVPADAVRGAPEGAALTVIGGMTTSTPPPTTSATPPPDHPDLAVADVISRQNLLVVFVTNDGNADVTGEVYVAIGEGEPHRVDVGKPVRPGELLEAVLPGEYVQRPATVRVTVSGGGSINEDQLENNVLETIVRPDLPNDIEINAASVDQATQQLQVTLRNNSAIPLQGYATLAVRQLPPESLLVGRIDVPFVLGPGELVTVPFELSAAVDLTRSQVLLSTDAIADADSTNDVFPR